MYCIFYHSYYARIYSVFIVISLSSRWYNKPERFKYLIVESCAFLRDLGFVDCEPHYQSRYKFDTRTCPNVRPLVLPDFIFLFLTKGGGETLVFGCTLSNPNL